MILFNVTVIIEEQIEQSWLDWIKGTFLPQVMSTDAFVSNRILKVLDSPNEGITYCLQFIADNQLQYDNFQANQAGRLLESHSLQFENRSVFFTTVMEFIS